MRATRPFYENQNDRTWKQKGHDFWEGDKMIIIESVILLTSQYFLNAPMPNPKVLIVANLFPSMSTPFILSVYFGCII
jgi:hypothetical protein